MKKRLELRKETVSALNGYRGGIVVKTQATCDNGGLHCLVPPTTVEPTKKECETIVDCHSIQYGDAYPCASETYPCHIGQK